MRFFQSTVLFFFSLAVFFSPTLAFAGGVKKYNRFVIKYKEKKTFMSNGFSIQKKRKSKKFKKSYSEAEMADLQASLIENDPDIEYIEPDIILTTQFEPGDGGTVRDPQYNNQWHYFESYGISLPQAWDITRGSSSIVVAVVDTGVLPHNDLSGKVLPGYDFISDVSMANDGNGRDNDAADPGDWMNWGDCGQFDQKNSSWHGTHVAGTVGANSGNGVGATGVSWESKILPVRVLGKCGGLMSDIADGIKWAAGVPVAGVPSNPNPAKVINLSLGGGGSCSATMQAAINQATNAGAVVVVAAGNSNSNMNFSQFTPANCDNVIVVAANNRNGNRSSYSNYGNKVDVTAPGGDNSDRIISLLNTGTTSPSSDTYSGYMGTSMATPHVAGVAALIYAVQPSLSPQQVKQILIDTADSFDNSSSCNSTICGSGIVNAYQAVLLAQSTTPTTGPQLPSNPPGGGFTPIYGTQEDENGGGCGTVDLDPNGSGPGQGPSLLVGFFLVVAFSRLKKLQLSFCYGRE